jgi:hypothetical protein
VHAGGQVAALCMVHRPMLLAHTPRPVQHETWRCCPRRMHCIQSRIQHTRHESPTYETRMHHNPVRCSFDSVVLRGLHHDVCHASTGAFLDMLVYVCALSFFYCRVQWIIEKLLYTCSMTLELLQWVPGCDECCNLSRRRWLATDLSHCCCGHSWRKLFHWQSCL